MIHTIDIDVVFAINLLADYLLLLATARVLDCPFKRYRLWLGAALGGVYAVVVFLPFFKPAVSLWGTLTMAVLMTLTAVGGLPLRVFIRYVLVFVAFSAALAGFVMGLQYLSGRSYLTHNVLNIPFQKGTLLLGLGISYLTLTLLFRRSARHGGLGRDLAEVCVTWDNRRILLSALLDTGNTLSEPMTGAPVMVTELYRVKGILPDAAALLIDDRTLKKPDILLSQLTVLGLAGRFRLIPYHSVGVECGLLLAFRPDSVVVGKKPRKGALVAFSPTPISNGAYSAIV